MSLMDVESPARISGTTLRKRVKTEAHGDRLPLPEGDSIGFNLSTMSKTKPKEANSH